MAIDTMQLLLQDRLYGGQLDDWLAKLCQPLPEVFEAMRNDLCGESALLAIKGDEGDLRGLAIVAFKYDVELLAQRRNEMAAFLKSSITCGSENISGDVPRDVASKATWDIVSEDVPAIEAQNILSMSTEIASMPDHVMLECLKQGFRDAALHLMRCFCYWLDILVEREIVGLAEWSSDRLDVCKLHYFRRSTNTTIVKNFKESWRTANLETKVYEQATTIDLFSQRIEEHLHGARLHTIKEFPVSNIPNRVIRLLENTPEWISGHLMIVDGHIGKEVVVEKAGGSIVEWEPVIETVRYDPGLALAGFVFAGWGQADINAKRTRAESEARDEASRRRTTKIAWVCVAAAVVIALAIGRFLASSKPAPTHAAAVPALRAIEINSTEASSWHNYDSGGSPVNGYPEYSCDNLGKTAWESQCDPVGQWLVFHMHYEVRNPQKVSVVCINNGSRPRIVDSVNEEDIRAEDAGWKTHCRIKQATLTADNGEKRTIVLKDTYKRQTIKLSSPLPSTRSICLTVDKVYVGTNGPKTNVGLSEIAFLASTKH